jgi:hypothetical protein
MPTSKTCKKAVSKTKARASRGKTPKKAGQPSKETTKASALENYQFPLQTLIEILKLLLEGGIMLPSNASSLTYWILRIIAEQEISQKGKDKMTTLGAVAEMAKRLTAVADAEAKALNQSTAPTCRPGIPLAEMLAPDFKIADTKRAGAKKDSVKTHFSSLFEKVVDDQDWDNHQLCWKYGFSSKDVHQAAQSVFDAVHQAILSTYEGSTEGEKLEDRAIIKAIQEEGLTTGERLALLAAELIEVEGMGVQLRNLHKLGDKLRNFENRKTPGKPRLSAIPKHEEFDVWLCRNWIQGAILCRLPYSEISKKWEDHTKSSGSEYGDKLVESRVNRALKLIRLLPSKKSVRKSH